ncbi:MAG: DUF4175 family protein [Pseudomonadota bacterium]
MAKLNDIPGLRAKIGDTRARLGQLAFVRAFGPALAFILTYSAAALFGLFERVSSVVGAGLGSSAILITVLLSLRGWRTWKRPTRTEARAVLDRQSPRRPISGLTDRPVSSTRDGQSLWKAHTDRLMADAIHLPVPRFWMAWRRADPAFLRFVLPVLFAGALIFAGADRADRLKQAFVPNLGALAGADNIRVEAWITPPSHTGRPPIFLEAGMQDIRVPAGSTVTLRAFNRSAPALVLSTEKERIRQRFSDTPDGAFEAQATLDQNTKIAVHWWGERVAWSILASPDAPPTVQFITLPSITTDDEMEFEWAVEDDFGVDRLEVAIRLREPHPAAPDAEDRLPVQMGPVAPKDASEIALLDTMRHRWAGLPVDVQLVAIDGAGQEGRSRSLPFILPGKLLLQPLARAAQEIRVTVLREPRDYDDILLNGEALQAGAINSDVTRRLDAAPPDVQLASQLLDALTLEPERYFEDRSVYFGLRMAHGILVAAPDKAEADSVDTLLWQVALKAEYGSSADALRALLAARRALEQALRDGASEDEIRRLMEAFREAANNYIAAKMAEAMMNGTESSNMSDMGPGGGGSGLGANQFEDMLNALEDLAETGAADQARQLLSDITNMLENLEFQQGGQGGGDGFAMPGQEGGEPGEDDELPQDEQELTEALEALSDLLREQRELNDDTLAEERGERSGTQPGTQGQEGNQGGSQRPGQGEADQGEQDGTEPGAGGLDDRQRSLADRTDQLGQAIGPGTGEEDSAGGGQDGETEGVGQGIGGLDEAARQRLEDVARLQDRAARELERGDELRANRLQERATGALRDLSDELAAAIDELQQARQGDLANEDDPDGNIDPFGRSLGVTGVDDDVIIPDEAERQRAKDILDELRRRFDQAEGDEEREYLERLLDRF